MLEGFWNHTVIQNVIEFPVDFGVVVVASAVVFIVVNLEEVKFNEINFSASLLSLIHLWQKSTKKTERLNNSAAAEKTRIMRNGVEE